MLTAAGILCILFLVAWWAMRRMNGEPPQKSWNLGYLRGFCIGLGRQLGWNLKDEIQQELFLHEYRQRVWVGDLPDSPEWRREVFKEDETRGAEFEKCRMLGIAMWYLWGEMGGHEHTG